MTDIAAERLQSLIARIERLEEEKAEIANDIREIYQEAKSAGFDTKIMRQVVKRRAMDKAERDEQDALLDTYEHAIGQLSGTPLGEAAAPKAEKPLTKAQERLKSSVDNLTREPGTSISVTSGGVTTTLENVDGTRVLTQTGEPTVDLGPPTSPVQSALAGLKQQMRAAG